MIWRDWPEAVSAEIGEQYYRHRDLGAPYSTGIPYPLALAMLDVYPDEFGANRDAFCAKFGVYLDPDDPDGLPVGFVKHRDRLTGIDFLMTNCSLCHLGMIDGKKVTGLGNRQLRLNALNAAILTVAARDDFTPERLIPAAEAAAKKRGAAWTLRGKIALNKAIPKLRELAASDTADAWGGMKGVDAGAGRNTAIEFAKSASKVPVAPPYSFAKYPALWMYKQRQTFGYDGALAGDLSIVLAAVEFNKNMPVGDILHHRERWRSLNAFIQTIEPPAFPRPIDTKLASEGERLFESHCVRCHRAPGQYKENVIDLDEIGTDPDRVHSVTPELIAARDQGPMAKWVHINKPAGYVVPPLEGVWCRAPYLHNGSVPTLEDLLRPEAERPVLFPVGDGQAYDFVRVGLPYVEDTRPDGRRAGKPAPRTEMFDIRKPGNRNSGHDFGTDLPAEDRAALLEYLKRY
jgi:mono/diheme cytochrome c family protein